MVIGRGCRYAVHGGTSLACRPRVQDHRSRGGVGYESHDRPRWSSPGTTGRPHSVTIEAPLVDEIVPAQEAAGMPSVSGIQKIKDEVGSPP